jgi:hypothetical protein
MRRGREEGLTVSLFAELKRRNVIRMAGLYLVGAWVIGRSRGRWARWRAAGAGSISVCSRWLRAGPCSRGYTSSRPGLKRDVKCHEQSIASDRPAHGRLQSAMAVVAWWPRIDFGCEPQRE